MSEPLAFNNPKVQRLRRLLGRRSARAEEGAFVVEGPALVGAAFEAGWEIEAIFLADATVPESLGLPPGLPRAGLATFDLAAGVLERVATTETPQPVLAVVRRRTTALADLTAAAFVLVGDRINDPGNAGTMIRSAEAAGADAVAFTAGSVDPFNPKVVRASAGALFAVPVVVDVSLADAVAGRHSVGTTSRGGTPYTPTPYTDVDFTRPTAIVVGNEAHGLDPDAPVDEWVTIPHAGRAESLNVAMATTLLVFEVARQRRRR